MRIAPNSHWEAGAIGGDGAVLAFDTPGCLMRYRFGPRGAGLHDAWVTEYYAPAGVHRDARSVRYAIGSDVPGPMGPDLVPVDPSRAEGFAQDHHPRATYDYASITAELLRAL